MNSRQAISGWEFLDDGDNEAARREFERCISLNPDNSIAYVGLGKALGRLEEDSAALDAFGRALSLDPENSEAYYGIGATYSHMGLLPEALDAFKQAIQLDPENPDAHYGAAWSYDELGERQKAIFHAKKAVALAPDVARHHIMAAKCIGNRDMETTLWHREMATRLADEPLGLQWGCFLVLYRVLAGADYSVHQFLMLWALIAAAYATMLSTTDLQRWLWIAALPFVGISGYNLVKRQHYRAIWAFGLGLLWLIAMYLLFVVGKGLTGG